MLTSIVVAIVRACTRFATLVVIASLLLAVGASYYAAKHFAINTDINKLISPDLDWRIRDNQFERAFDREKLILAVVEAPTKADYVIAVGGERRGRLGGAAAAPSSTLPRSPLFSRCRSWRCTAPARRR